MLYWRWGLATVCLFFCGGVRGEQPGRPNIVLILADDLGWHDLGCYGHPWFETPHLDRLAEEGLRMTRAYAAAPICSASRAGLLTGKTPARLGFEFVTKSKPGLQPVDAPLHAPPYTLALPLQEVTIAESLRDANYQTAFFGKWHLNPHYQHYLGWSPTHGPKAQGFDIAEEDFGGHPYSYYSDKSQRPFLELAEGEFPADSMTERAVKFLQSQQPQTEAGRPFFLMVSHFYVHTPVHTRIRWLYDRSRDRIPVNHPRRDALARYGAMVATLDHLVGRVLKTLEETGLADDTLVVFTSDNGGHPAYAGNAPLRGSKWNLYEGGIRVPCLVRWPSHIPEHSVSDTPVSSLDLFPTFAQLANARLPADTDGCSWEPWLLDPTASLDSRPLLWHFPYYHPEGTFDSAPGLIGVDDGVTSQTRPHSAWQSGPWKLLHFYEDQRDELYHLPSDPAEQRDRVQTDPETASQLRQTLDRTLQSQHARFPTREAPPTNH
ncbi:MAG: sulfatase [Planctomycetaceae bacterium]